MARKEPFDISYDEATAIRTDKGNAKSQTAASACPVRGHLGCYRVLYGVDEEKREVQIQAIGMKQGNRLVVGGEEVEL
jgi:mRNA-degrading endonuclease RelE of RelBE toxin-antitoxin system